MNFYRINYVQSYIGNESDSFTKYVFADNVDDAYRKINRYFMSIGISEWITNMMIDVMDEEEYTSMIFSEDKE